MLKCYTIVINELFESKTEKKKYLLSNRNYHIESYIKKINSFIQN